MGKELSIMSSSEHFYIETDMASMRNEALVSDKFVIVLVEKGTARMAIGDDEYQADVHRMLLVHPNLPVRLVRSAGGFRAVFIGFSPVMLHERTQLVEPNSFLLFYTRVAWSLAEKHRKPMERFKELFRFAVTGTERFRREIILALVTGFVFGFYEVCGNLQVDDSYADSSRSKELFRKFMQLLREYYKTQHEVQFYAGKLCISAKYLTQITKRMIARTPKQIIDELLIHEAATLLGKNDSSIQEISNRLGFVDQSYFGRFFKRMMNVSPQQYRVRPRG